MVGSRPSPDIGGSCPIADIGRTEFSIPVAQSVTAEYGLGRLLCSASYPPRTAGSWKSHLNKFRCSTYQQSGFAVDASMGIEAQDHVVLERLRKRGWCAGVSLCHQKRCKTLQPMKRGPTVLATRLSIRLTHYMLQVPGFARSSFATAALPCSSGINSSPAPPTNTPILMYCRMK